MRQRNLNLFQFFQDVALRFQAECLGINGIDGARHNVLNQELTHLKEAYFAEDGIEYDSPDRMVAYTLHFAPKHAVIWRCMAQRFTSSGEGEDWKLNAIGPGPGSELFGILCGLPDAENLNIDFVGLEREGAWRDLFEIAREEFILRTGLKIDGFLTNDPKNLEPEGQVIGSLVLSDAARHGELVKLAQDISGATSSGEGWFLDFNYKVPMGNGTREFLNQPLRRAGFATRDDPLKDDLQLAKAIRDEMADCNHLYCTRPVKENLPLNFYKVRLR
ncbi:MAG: hypothetical protein BGO01_08555 [Armatimonadetes bacterium 55-13]|nr:MAG: hypothetical protein BGO01_08555 [Armatimonadetes bacterium 55-13]